MVKRTSCVVFRIFLGCYALYVSSILEYCGRENARLCVAIFSSSAT